MEISRVTSKGQITIPIEIRKKLNLKTGDKVVFIEEGDKIIFANSSMIALREFQEGMKGEAERAGIHSEEELSKLVKEIRKELWGKSMRIMIDTNVLISAVLFPNPLMTKLLDKVALEHTLTGIFIMEELQMLFETKFSGKKILLDRFLLAFL